MSLKNGDLAISIFDLDLSDSKKEQLKKAKEISDRNNITIISSNPCFEVWYLDHFGYTSKPFNNNIEMIASLRKHIPDYQKNQCNFDKLYPLTDEAIRNCEKLDEHHRKIGSEDIFEFNNPRTDMYKIVKLIKE